MRQVIVLCCLASLLACTNDPSSTGNCRDGLTIAVSSAVEPEVSWTPTSCPVNEVYLLQAGIVLWHLSSTTTSNIIESPVRPGEPARPGTGGSIDEPRLTPGIIYEFILWRVEENESVIAGEHRFLYRPHQ
jgi:hypothetical protein